MNCTYMRECVEDYMINARERNRLLEMFDDPTHRAISSKHKVDEYDRFKTSDTERKAIRNITRDNLVRNVTRKMNYVDMSMCVLDPMERKIINYIKYGDSISSIARTVAIERRKVARIRDEAIKKMSDKVNNTLSKEI